MFLKAGCDYQSLATVVQESSLNVGHFYSSYHARIFCLFLFDVIRPDFRAQETKTWIESGCRKSCGNMSTAWK